jgi:hypothetical protein
MRSTLVLSALILLATGCGDIEVPDELPTAQLRVYYEEGLTAYNVRPPARYDLYAGALPPGLELAPDGSVFGTPLGIGSYAFDVRVIDAQDRWIVTTLHIEVTAEPDQVYVGPILDPAQLNGVCLEGVPSIADTLYLMCQPWVRIDGAGMPNQSERLVAPGVFWVGEDGAADGGWGDDLLLLPLAAGDVTWAFQADESWPEATTEGLNSPDDTFVSGDGVLVAGERTGPGRIVVDHPEYGAFDIEVVVVPPDFCPSPEGC